VTVGFSRWTLACGISLFCLRKVLWQDMSREIATWSRKVYVQDSINILNHMVGSIVASEQGKMP
jgi:hypothetical protein